MKILAVETSCDETGIAILKKDDKIEVLSHQLASQVNLHKEYGGVHPTLAIREHRKKLPFLLDRALKEANHPKLDYLAVTIGPGLEPCLWTGIEFVKTLSIALNKKVIPVNHIEAHILVTLMNRDLKDALPALALIVSGGHTQLILVKEIGQYEIIGETRDDAAGECFDKTARIIGLPYPGGPAISEVAKEDKQANIDLPRPMINSKNYDFSFSGLKTAVLYDHRDRTKKPDTYTEAMAFEIQEAIKDVLVSKTVAASQEFDVKSVILGGGVSANKRLREELKKNLSLPLLKVSPSLATDNGIMIGVAALLHPERATIWSELKADANLRV